MLEDPRSHINDFLQALNREQLQQVREVYQRHPEQHLMVGFNRRFAPLAVEAARLLKGRAQPLAVNLMINAGEIPANTWIQDPAVGGGRIVGEVC